MVVILSFISPEFASKEIFLDIKKLVVFGFINSLTFGNSNICVKGDSPVMFHVGMQSLRWNFILRTNCTSGQIWGSWQFWGYSTVLWPLNPWKDGNSSNLQKQMHLDENIGIFQVDFSQDRLNWAQRPVQSSKNYTLDWNVESPSGQRSMTFDILIVCSQRSDASNLEFWFFIKTALSLSPFLATIVHCLASYCQNELWPWL